MNNYSDQTLGEIVIQQHKAAALFEKYNLDFCCKGKRSLAAACGEKGIAVDIIADELASLAIGTEKETSFEEMTAAALISHILRQHHHYVKQFGPTIKEHLDRVAGKHGDKFPWMKDVAQYYTAVLDDLIQHMQKEEVVLFPRIERMESSEKGTYPVNLVAAPIGVMEAEHEAAGNIMQHIRDLTENYSWPEAACTTYRVSMLELKEFEENLHQHVHLENNILFPKALTL
ncbi:MAG TPA: iron-sulfur cluster repair di-iron protein [Chitinophagaceae bacterium]|nr:iron-sulfur cluster repair di-iron protein [Chitinophagaceae bacterium]